MLIRYLLNLLLLVPLLAFGQHKQFKFDSSAPLIFFSLDSIVTSYSDHSSFPGLLTLAPSAITESLTNPLSASEIRLPHYLFFALRSDKPRLIYLFWGETSNARVNFTDVNGLYLAEIKARTYPGATTSVFPVQLPGDSVCRIVVRLQVSNNEPEFHGWVIGEGQLENFFLYYRGTLEGILSLNWWMAGMLLMMMLYISSKFIQIKSAEYGYYAAYIAFMLGYVAFKLIILVEPNVLTDIGDWYFFINNQLQVFAYCMYFPFLTAFLNTRRKNSSLHRVLLILPVVLLVYTLTDGILIFFGLMDWHDRFWNGIRAILLFIVLNIAYRVFQMKTPYGIYPILGGVSLDFFALLSMLFSLHPEWTKTLPSPFYHGIFYYFVGISVELIFFSLGLGLKNRKDEVEKVEAQQALKLAEERQKFEHLKTVVEVRETERARIAKDLHDGVGGTLSGITISLTNLLPKLGIAENERFQYERAIDLINSSVSELRLISHNMMPPAITNFGLVAALQDLCESISSMKSIVITMQVMGVEKRLPDSNEIVIFRVVQELINNIVKHAQASQALLQLSFDKRLLSITIEDDGYGFDPDKVDETKSAGLKNIRSRIDFLKGIMDVRSNKQGTSIHIEIPVIGIP